MSSSYFMNLLASAVAVIVGIVIHEMRTPLRPGRSATRRPVRAGASRSTRSTTSTRLAPSSCRC